MLSVLESWLKKNSFTCFLGAHKNDLATISVLEDLQV
jgi:hypothetical protein